MRRIGVKSRVHMALALSSLHGPCRTEVVARKKSIAKTEERAWWFGEGGGKLPKEDTQVGFWRMYRSLLEWKDTVGRACSRRYPKEAFIWPAARECLESRNHCPPQTPVPWAIPDPCVVNVPLSECLSWPTGEQGGRSCRRNRQGSDVEDLRRHSKDHLLKVIGNHQRLCYPKERGQSDLSHLLTQILKSVTFFLWGKRGQNRTAFKHMESSPVSLMIKGKGI